MKISNIFPLLLFVSVLIANRGYCTEHDYFEIQVSKPKFVLPQFTGSYQEREASIAPEEYEKAEVLKSLIDDGNTQAVLTELEKYYDIELSPAMQTLKAQVYFSLKMYKEAEETYLSVLKRKPQLVRAHSDLAQLYLVTSRPKDARNHFARAVEFGANEAIIHGQLGYLNLTQYGPFSAISEYQKAMALEPENTQWQQGLLAALTKAKMYDAAAALIGEILTLNPQTSDLWLNKATLYLKQENSFDALACLEMALLLGDDSEANLRIAAQLHLTQKSYDRAIDLIGKHLKKVNFRMSTLSSYMLQLESLNLWADVRKLLKQISPSVRSFTDADKSIFYFHQAVVQQHLGNKTKSSELYDRSLRENPLNGVALLKYAKFALENNEYSKSELLYIRAEALEEVEMGAMLGRSQLYIQLQDYGEALKHLRMVKAKYPHVLDLSEKIEIVENIVKSREVH